MIFTLVFLSFRGQSYFQNSNILVKGLTLSYVLNTCYRLGNQSGSCLNPALGLTESIYMLLIQWN